MYILGLTKINPDYCGTYWETIQITTDNSHVYSVNDWINMQLVSGRQSFHGFTIGRKLNFHRGEYQIPQHSIVLTPMLGGHHS